MTEIIIDTREQQPWAFSFYGFDTVREKLDEGDYSTVGIRNIEKTTDKKILCIERKQSSGELAGNLGKGDRRFRAELERMSEYDHKYLILEFTLEVLLAFPEGSGIPKNRWFRRNKDGKLIKNIRMSGNYLKAKVEGMAQKYGFTLIYAEDREDAIKEAVDIIKRVEDEHKEEI